MEGEEVQKVICSDRDRGSYVGHSSFLSSLACHPLPYVLRLLRNRGGKGLVRPFPPRLCNSHNEAGRGWCARLIFECLVLSSV